MSKQSGLGDNLYVAGYNLSGDIGELGRIGGGPALLETTGIDKSAYERIGGLRDGAMEFTSFFNPATDKAHPRLSTLPTSDVLVTYCRGTDVGNPAAGLTAKQINYDGSRESDGAFTFEVEAQANGYGLEWGKLLTAGVREDTEATDGDSIDTSSSKSFGLQAYLHVFEFTGTDVSIAIEDSADDSAFSIVTNAEFTEVTSAPFVERIETGRAQTVRRYLRVATTTDAGFTSLSFAVVVVKNGKTVNF